MQTTYAQKNDTVQKASANTAESVVDSSLQSATLQRHAALADVVAQRAPEPRPNLTGMPDNLKSGIESLSGYSMDDVRVHYNSDKPATVQALAYTQGTDIHVAPGQEHTLPHEAWHVAQQMAGRVSPTTNINGMPVNDNAGLEHEADVMGEKAVQCKKNCDKEIFFHSNKSLSNTFQLMNINYPNDQIKKINKYKDLCIFLLEQNSFLRIKLGIDNEESVSNIKKTIKEELNVSETTLGQDTYGQIDVFWCDSLNGVIDELRLHQIHAAPVVNPQRSIEDIIENDFVRNNNVYLLEDSQIRHISAYRKNGFMKTDQGNLYHISGHSRIQKPIWSLDSGKIKVLGLYQHPDGNNQQYDLRKGKGPKTITII